MRLVTSVLMAAALCFGAVPAQAEKLVLVAGGGDGADGSSAVGGQLKSPFGVHFDQSGDMYVVELTGQRIRKVDRNGVLTTVAGTGELGKPGNGPAARAQFNGMHSLAIAPDGMIYVSDTWNNCIRRFDPRTGVISTFAGTGEKGFGGDGGPALQATFGGIYCVALDPSGQKMYLADLDNRRIRAVDMKTGAVETIAGNGEKGVPADGADAKTSPLVDPRAVTADREGNVYVLERSGHALRVVNPSGQIKTVVGTGAKGFAGDDGDARQAMLNGPKHLCIDLDGNVIIADTENHVIRKYLPRDGKIVRVAGTGKKGTAGVGGSPFAAEFNQPHGVYIHPTGTLYITDSSNHRVLKIVKD